MYLSSNMALLVIVYSIVRLAICKDSTYSITWRINGMFNKGSPP